MIDGSFGCAEWLVFGTFVAIRLVWRAESSLQGMNDGDGDWRCYKTCENLAVSFRRVKVGFVGLEA